MSQSNGINQMMSSSYMTTGVAGVQSKGQHIGPHHQKNMSDQIMMSSSTNSLHAQVVNSPVNRARGLTDANDQHNNQSLGIKGAPPVNPQHIQLTTSVLNQSESLKALLRQCDSDKSIELCEIFAIIGATDLQIQRSLINFEKAQNCDLPFSGSKAECDSDSSFYIVEGQRRHSLLTKEGQSKEKIKCTSSILNTYPKIYEADGGTILEKYLYLSNIQLICFPNGYIIEQDIKSEGLKANFKVMHFTITQSSGEKKFLTSLEYREPCMIYLSTAPTTMSGPNIQVFERRRFCLVPRQLLMVSRLPLFALQRQMLEFMYHDLVEPARLQLGSFAMKDLSLDELETAFTNSKKSINESFNIEFFLSTFLHHLRIDGTHIQVELNRKTSKTQIIRYINNNQREFGSLRLENYDYRVLFQKVKPQMLMQIFVSLLHERKIIIIQGSGSDEDSNRNGAIIIETFISLLYPLQWNFTNISCLIPSMIDYLEAPFPYIVGVSRELWRHIYEHRWQAEQCHQGDEVVAFDLDTERVYIRGMQAGANIEQQLPEFPQPYTQLLIKQLEKQLERARDFSPEKTPSSAQVRRDPIQSKEEIEFWSQFTLKVKQQFLNFLIFLINTFENFYNPEGKSDAEKHSYMGGLRGNSANDIFNFQDYVQNVRENQPFFERFIKTQAFINFIEQAHGQSQHQHQMPIDSICEPHLTFFKECTRKLSQDSILAVRSMQDDIIMKIMNSLQNRSITYSIEKCKELYESQLKLFSNHTPQPQSMPAGQNPDIKGRESLYLIGCLDHEKIIQMPPFDPKPLIQKRYLQELKQQQKAHHNRSLQVRGTAINYSSHAEPVRPQKLFQQPHFKRDELSTSLQQLKPFHQPRNIGSAQPVQMSNNISAATSEYFSIQPPQSLAQPKKTKADDNPKSQSVIRVEELMEVEDNFKSSRKEKEQSSSQERLNLIRADQNAARGGHNIVHEQIHEEDQESGKFGDLSIMHNNLIRIPLEDRDYDEYDEEIDGEDKESSEEEKEGTGILGFFKKTFSSVKKTFQSTFNQRRDSYQLNNHQRASTRPRSKLEGRRTPIHEFNYNKPFPQRLDESPRLEASKQNRVKFSGTTTAQAGNRANRSLTFHVEVPREKLDEKEPSFIQNLINLGSTAKKASRRQAEVIGQTPKGKDQKDDGKDFYDPLDIKRHSKLNSTVQPGKRAQGSKHKLNSSGFFVFDEDDMKKMTEMSPRDAITSRNQKQHVKGASLNFDMIESKIENIRHQHQRPQIKANTIFNSGNPSMHQQYLSNRIRSVSYQQGKQTVPTIKFNIAGSGKDEPVDTRQLIDDSLKLFEKFPLSTSNNAIKLRNPQNNLEPSQKSERDSVRMYQNQVIDIQPSQINLANSNSQSVLSHKQQALFRGKRQGQLSLIKEDNTSMTDNTAIQNMTKDGTRSQAEFDEIYKQNTGNPTEEKKVQGKDQKFNIWKSSTAKATGDTAHSNSSRPPKYTSNQSSNQVSTKKKPTYRPSGQRMSERMHAMLDKEEKKQHPDLKYQQQVITVAQHDSVVFSDDGKNSTDDDLKSGPIGTKNLAQFRNMMMITKARPPPFDRNTKANNHAALNTSHTVKKSTQGNDHAVNTMLAQHRRQISQGLTLSNGSSLLNPNGQNQQVQLGATHENIEPDEDEVDGNEHEKTKDLYTTLNSARGLATSNMGATQLSQGLTNSKQIESMQVGRVRKKSSQQRTSGSKTQPHGKKGVLTVHTQKLELNSQRSSDNIKGGPHQKISGIGGNFQMGHQTKQLASTLKSVKAKVTDANPIEEQDNDDDMSQIGDSNQLRNNHTRLNYKHIQAKTVESSSNNSDEDESREPLGFILIKGRGEQKNEDDKTLTKSQIISGSYSSKNIQSIDKFGESAKQLVRQMMDDTVRIMGIATSTINNRSEVVTPQTLLQGQRNTSKHIVDLRSANQNHQQRTHSLSQYAQLPTYQNNKRAPLEDNFLLMDNLKATKAIHINQTSHTVRNTVRSIGPTAQSVSKPLNKITWDSFSQIAKLTGDVDHEPSTPKSGQQALLNSDDDEGYDIE